MKPGGINFKQTNEDSGTYYQANCLLSPATGSCPLPRDRDLANLGGNAWQTSLRGTGATQDDLNAYWFNHHGSATIPQYKGQDVTTRWQIYQMENDGTTYPFTNKSESFENAAPQCKDSLPAADLNRRVINVAIVDCEYWDIKGSSSTLPVTTLMAKFFMTEPADTNGKIYAELIQTYQLNGSGSSIYQIVQLVK